MPINRAEITQQLLLQLQEGLADTAQVSLLRLPDTPLDLPQMLILLGKETVVVNDDLARPKTSLPPNLGRKILFSVQTQVAPSDEVALMQTLDTLAEGIEVALTDRDEESLWLHIFGMATEFEFTASAEGLAATMVQSFELTYQVIRQSICLAPKITEVYLSRVGDEKQLIASVSAVSNPA